MRHDNWFRMFAWGACSAVMLVPYAVCSCVSVSAQEPPKEQYITLDDGLYTLQADGTYSKVEGKRPQAHAHTHNHDHVHDHGAGGRPSAGVPQQNEKYLRLDDGLYVLQSDGTYMRAQDVPRPASPGYRPNSNNQQVWQNGGRRPQPQRQDNDWDDDDNGWNQPQWQNGGRRPQPQPQWQGNGYRPQPQWQNNGNMRPNRPSNNQDAAAFGNFIQGLSNAINQSQVRPPRPAPFVQPIQPQFVNPTPAPMNLGTLPSSQKPVAPSVQPQVNQQIGGTSSMNLSAGQGGK